jgi:hypothetical protein
MYISLHTEEDCDLLRDRPVLSTRRTSHENKHCNCLGNVKVMLSLFLTRHHAMKMYWGVEVELHAFLTLKVVEVSGQLRDLAALPPGKGTPLPIG